MKLIINNGSRYGMLTVVNEVDRIKLPCGQHNRAFKCLCDCGNSTIVRLLHLVRGRIQSCGCKLGEVHLPEDKHLRNVYRGMVNRCYGNKTIQPHLYKDKGIRVCSDWLESFYNFKKWALENGYNKSLQIDRIDGNKNYCPENCRWVTPLENSNNRSCTTKINYKGEVVSLSLLLHKQGKHKHYAAILGRIKRGWDHEKAVDYRIKEFAKQKGIEL